jgi:hypothetical protein
MSTPTHIYGVDDFYGMRKPVIQSFSVAKETAKFYVLDKWASPYKHRKQIIKAEAMLTREAASREYMERMEARVLRDETALDNSRVMLQSAQDLHCKLIEDEGEEL